MTEGKAMTGFLESHPALQVEGLKLGPCGWEKRLTEY